MATIRFAKDGDSLVKSLDALLVLAPAAALKGAAAPGAAALPEKHREALLQLAAALEVGPRGALAETRSADGKLRLVLGLLPDQPSRYVGPTRAFFAQELARRSALATASKCGALLLLDAPEHWLAVAAAVVRCFPLCDLRSGKSGNPSSLTLAGHVLEQGAINADRWSREVLGATRAAARLVDLPPSELDPAGFARECKELLRGVPGVRLREITGAKLLEEKLGGIHGVGRCAKSPPRMLIASLGSSRTKGTHVCLVGKGITYDTGGLSLKGREHMVGMKGDMGGAAAVLGAFRALAGAGIAGRVTAILCVAENAIGPEAVKPDDVLTLHSGKTVEINNTDAEGRLVLADGVSYAARKLQADVIVDAATLTGAQGVATGIAHAAIVANDVHLERLLIDVGLETGDLTHPLPFAPDLYQKEFESRIADMKNSVANRANAQSACAAQFIHAHLPERKLLWGHVDLASPSRIEERGTGFGVVLLAELTRRLTA